MQIGNGRKMLLSKGILTVLVVIHQKGPARIKDLYHHSDLSQLDFRTYVDRAVRYGIVFSSGPRKRFYFANAENWIDVVTKGAKPKAPVNPDPRSSVWTYHQMF